MTTFFFSIEHHVPHSYRNSVGLELPGVGVSSGFGTHASAVATRSECNGCVGGKNSSRVCSWGDIGVGRLELELLEELENNGIVVVVDGRLLIAMFA